MDEEYDPFDNTGCHCVPGNNGFPDYFCISDALTYVLQSNNLTNMQLLVDHYSKCNVDFYSVANILGNAIENNQTEMALIILRSATIGKTKLLVWNKNIIVKILELGFSLDLFDQYYRATDAVRYERDLFHQTIREENIVLPNVLLNLVANYSIF